MSAGDITLSFTIAAFTGSNVMFAQGLQGIADLITTLFLLIGVRRTKRKPTPKYPYGFGREIFFWTLLSSLFAFLVSGSLATWRAFSELISGNNDLVSLPIAVAALSFGLITNGYSLRLSIHRLSNNSTTQSLWQHIRHSSMIETKMTLLVDLMGTLSAGLGLIALVLSFVTGNALFDNAGALLIGLLTGTGALFVILDLRDLIIGRSPHPLIVEKITQSALSVRGVNDVLDLKATAIGSGKFLVILEVHFEDRLTTDDIEKITDDIKSRVQKHTPEITHVQVEAETPA